jgi:hypothetical protein
MDDYVQSELQTFVKKLKLNKNSYIFLDEIENVIKEYPDYSTKIKHPIDLVKIIDKVDKGEYNSLDKFNEDIELMINNCLTYNYLPQSSWNRQGLEFRKYYENNYEKFITKIQKHNEKKYLLGKKRVSTGIGMIKQKSTNILKSGVNESKIGKDDFSNINSSLTVYHFEDEKIAKSIKNLFMSIKPHLNTSEKNIESVINTLVEGFSKSNKTNDELYDIGLKFITRHLNKKEEKTKFMKDFQTLIRDMKNKQKEESTKLDQKTLIKIDLNENEANREERMKLEKIRKTVKKYLEEHKVPGIYLDKEEYSIEPELKKKIYNFVTNLRSKFTTGNNINSKLENNNKKEKDIGIDENDLANLD